jgi:hypothetical protein
MNQHDKRTDRVLAQPCTSPVVLAIQGREARAHPAAPASWHAFHDKLILPYLDAYCSVKLRLTERRRGDILVSSSRMLTTQGVPNEEG